MRRFYLQLLVCLTVIAATPAIVSAQVVGREVQDGQVLAMQPVNAPVLAGTTNETALPAATNLADQKKLLNYLKRLKVNDQPQAYQSNKNFYYHLANDFARLRLYPLAMKCFLKTAPAIDREDADSTALQPAYFDPNTFDDVAVDKQAGNLAESKSKPISYQRIADVFNDGKKAVGYAMLFHVKQPAPGKRKIFVWTNTGHTFITLIKYNADSTYTSASFGFYPHKDHLLSATPIAPSTSAVFKDDAGHKWDEVMGKFITRRKFEKILKLTGDFSLTDYNLNNHNCTDFGLQAAALAGIDILNTKGSWPLGSGNNPAFTGQAILEGKVAESTKALFSADTINAQP